MSTETINELEIFPLDGIERALCVVAHPDDVEYGTSAAMAAWIAAGVEVHYLLLTSGEAGMQRPPAEVGPLRAREQQAACDAVGVARLDILDFPDGMLEYGLPLRRAVARAIREFRPNAVITMTWDEAPSWGLNHADHRAAGLATADAIRDADNTWVFPELAEEGLEKWHSDWLLVAGSEEPSHAVDVSGEPLERGIASLEAHEAYLAELPWHPAPRDMLTEISREAGRSAGVDAAIGFRAFSM
ncbi:PIG-L deacetylase family protein [Dietzia sp.]|uniref:PIG-L deacetylase family protein n=1 Tax=Dietzia sp. TaxID=1871616 RepID=UPI002FD8B0AE